MEAIPLLRHQRTLGPLPDQLTDCLTERQAVACGVRLRHFHRIIFELKRRPRHGNIIAQFDAFTMYPDISLWLPSLARNSPLQQENQPVRQRPLPVGVTVPAESRASSVLV